VTRAVVDATATVFAVTHLPVTGVIYGAVLGGGARVNGAPKVIDPDQGLAGCMTALGASQRTAADHVAAVVFGLMAAGGVSSGTGLAH